VFARMNIYPVVPPLPMTKSKFIAKFTTFFLILQTTLYYFRYFGFLRGEFGTVDFFKKVFYLVISQRLVWACAKRCFWAAKVEFLGLYVTVVYYSRENVFFYGIFGATPF